MFRTTVVNLVSYVVVEDFVEITALALQSQNDERHDSYHTPHKLAPALGFTMPVSMISNDIGLLTHKHIGVSFVTRARAWRR